MSGEIDLIGFISQVGFPIAVSAFCLLKLNKTIETMTKAVNVMAARLGCEEAIRGGGDNG